jgi:hypothetical protein
VGHREEGPTSGVNTMASTSRQGRGVGPGMSAILDDVKRRRESTLVARPRQALDGSQYGGTQPTDISRINRRCYWSRSCPAAGSPSRQQIGHAVRADDPARLRGPLLGGRSARRPRRLSDRARVSTTIEKYLCARDTGYLTSRSHINASNEPRAAAL